MKASDYRLTVTLTRKTEKGRETVVSHQWNGDAASINANGIRLRVVGGNVIDLELNGLHSPKALS